jgi:hypothetical protein
MAVQWTVPPSPEHFDHRIDLLYQWLQTRNPLWLERGAFGSSSADRPDRPDRYEPRVKKRRAKEYDLMKKPRADYKRQMAK